MLSAHIHRNSLLLAHLLTFTFLPLSLSLSLLCTHGLMHKDVNIHIDTSGLPSHRGKHCLESIVLLSVHWLLVVNNDMTQPVECLLFT